MSTTGMTDTLSDKIREDLALRLRTGVGLPERLSLNELARLYGVSPMPIRAAVRQLLRRKALRRMTNGRLAPGPAAKEPGPEAPPPPPVAPPPKLRGSAPGKPGKRPGGARSRAGAAKEPPAPAVPVLPDFSAAGRAREARVFEELLRMSLLGRDEFLREAAFAARHGLSRTVIRQLFSRLVGRGLLEHVPRRGWRVRPFREDDMRAYLSVRETLEVKALDLAADRLDTARLQEMLRGNRPDVAGAERLDNRLHAYILETAGNRYVQDFFDRHGPYFSALFDYAAPAAHVVAEMADQHRTILQHLIDRDWPAARKALASHIRAQEPIVSRMIRDLRASPDAEG